MFFDYISQNADDYFFIQSTVGFEMVMDVEHSNPDPGTPVISYCRNHPELVYNQLWMKEHIGEGRFYLVSKLGPDCKLSIQVHFVHFSVSTKLLLFTLIVPNLLYGFLTNAYLLRCYFYYHLYGSI